MAFVSREIRLNGFHWCGSVYTCRKFITTAEVSMSFTSIASVLNSGLQGIQSGISRVNKTGGQIAGTGPSTGTADLTASLVDL